MLFLCTHNAGRSQMALGFFTHHAGDAAIAWSGGTEPGVQVNPAAIAAMAERGIDIASEYPEALDRGDRAGRRRGGLDGLRRRLPGLSPARRYVEWDLDDPAGLDVADVRPIRDDVERRVLELMTELGIAPNDPSAGRSPTPTGTA